MPIAIAIGMKTIHEIWLDEPADAAEQNNPAGNCTTPQIELNAWLDGELPVPAHAAYALRLAADPDLRSRMSELDQIRTLVLHAYDAIHKH